MQHHEMTPSDDNGSMDVSGLARVPGYANTADRTRSRPSSPASIVSLSQSLFQDSFEYREEFGRSFNTRSNTYMLPADNTEMERLDYMHDLVYIQRGRNYTGPVRDVLAPVLGQDKAVLDLGCGTGKWVVEMAAEFPHCSFVGVDLAPIQPQPCPPNCRFEVDDINLGLEHFYGVFDMVHCRMISAGINDYHKLVDQIAQVLRPGGMLLIEETDLVVCDEHFSLMDAEKIDAPNHSWHASFMRCVKLAAQKRGGDRAPACLLKSWLGANPSLTAPGHEDYYTPIGS